MFLAFTYIVVVYFQPSLTMYSVYLQLLVENSLFKHISLAHTKELI